MCDGENPRHTLGISLWFVGVCLWEEAESGNQVAVKVHRASRPQVRNQNRILNGVEKEEREVDKAVLQVGQKGTRRKKMNTLESNSHLSAAVRLMDGGRWAVHVAWAFGKMLSFFPYIFITVLSFQT